MYRLFYEFSPPDYFLRIAAFYVHSQDVFTLGFYKLIIMRVLTLFASIATVLCLNCSAQKKGSVRSAIEQPHLGTISVSILNVEGLRFKDLNKNGRLDTYEDWRLSPGERSKDLLTQMSLDQKIGMMLIPDIKMMNEVSLFGSQKQMQPVTSELNEKGDLRDKNLFTGETLPSPVLSTVGTTDGIRNKKLRHFIWRTTTASADTVARWVNRLQALAENEPLGIPVLLTSNPRNHLATGGGSVISSSSEALAFSKWPTELGLAAMRDPEMVQRFADMARQEWLALGIRKGYMYMADLATEPRWQRTEGTFGEDPKLTAQCITAIVRGFQGNALNNSSIALTTKHFPGGGSGYKGWDAHYEYGRNEVFPAHRFSENLLSFKAAITAGTSAIMPYYSLPKGTQYEEVGYAFNKGVIKNLLRDSLGFKGIINSDTGPIESMPWGVKNLTVPERYIKALEAGVNLFSGNGEPAQLLKTVKGHPELEPYIDHSNMLLLEELFKLGLFEDPYVDEQKVSAMVGKKEFVEAGKLAQRKSIVLLRNEQKELPLKKGTKVYFEEYVKRYRNVDSLPGIVFKGEYPGLRFVSAPEEADVILLWLKPTIRPIFPADPSPLQANLSNCAINTDYVNRLTAKKPTILVVNYSNPFVIDEVYNPKTATRFIGVLATFGVRPDALLDVISGKFNPGGRMPFTTPKDQNAVENNKEDLPGYLEGSGYAMFKFDEGIGYD